MLGGGLNGFSKLLQASYMLGGGQNGLSKLAQASYGLMWLSKQTLRTSKSLVRAWQ